MQEAKHRIFSSHFQQRGQSCLCPVERRPIYRHPSSAGTGCARRRAPSRRPHPSQGSPPWRSHRLSEHGGFSFPSSLRHLGRCRVSQALPHMPGPVAGWHKAGIVHARRPERRANCLSQLGATICWQPDLCHYITGDSPTCKRISRTCLSSLILEKQ